MSHAQQGQVQRHPHFQKFPLERKIGEILASDAEWSTKVNSVWDLCQEHLDHDMDQLRKLQATPDQIYLAVRDGMHDWSAQRDKIVSALIAGPPQAART
jgi:hypothetical protein